MGTRMDKEIIWTAPDGSMNINTICAHAWVPDIEEEIHEASLNTDLECPTGYRAATDEEFAQWLSLKLGFTECHIVPRDTMQMDNYFRKAWKHDHDGFVSVDMVKAVEVHKERLREMRAEQFPDLDIKQNTARVRGQTDEELAIEERKQELRDITKHPEIEAATTPEELKVAALSVLEKT